MIRQNYKWLLLLAILGFTVYAAGLDSLYFGDDFQGLFSTFSSNIFEFWYKPNPYNPFYYRPLQATIMHCIQLGWGIMNATPLHVFQIILLVLNSYLVLLLALRNNFPLTTAKIASLIMLFSQANSFAVLSNDTIAQQLSVFWGCLSFIFLYDHLKSRDSLISWSSLAAFVVALFSKESAFPFVAIIALIFFFHNRSLYKGLHLYKRTVVQLLPYGIAQIIYLFIRYHGVISQPNQFLVLDKTIFVNIIQLTAAVLIPFSSDLVYIASKEKNILSLIMIGGALTLWCGFILYGIGKSKIFRNLAPMIFFWFIGMFPMVFMSHVSEQYAYNSMPFVSIILGSGVAYFLNEMRKKEVGMVMKISVALIMILWVCSNIYAIQHKAERVTFNSYASKRLLDEITPYIKQLPHNGTVVLIDPVNPAIEYSIYHLNDFNVLRWGDAGIKAWSRRQDITIILIDGKQAPPVIPMNAMCLTLENGHVVKIKTYKRS